MSPDEILATLIVDALVSEGLIDEGRAEDARAKIAAGTASQDDWGLWVELSPAVLSAESQNATSR